MGFAEQLQEIIQRLPDTRQTLLFSATLPKLLVEFARAGEINTTEVSFLHEALFPFEANDINIFDRVDRTGPDSFGCGF